jgi:hypothetical protein
MEIKTVSMLTQIKPTYLEDLEAGNWHVLPAEVYIKGFIKQLAELYHLREQDLIDQFQKEYSFLEFKPKARQYRPRINLTPKHLVLTASIVLSLGALIYIASQVRSVMGAPLLEIIEPISDITIAGNSTVVADRAEIGATVTINNQAVLSDKNGQFTENLILSPGLNVIEVKAKNKFGRESSVVRKINAEITALAEATGALPVNITLEVGPGSAWIYMEADGVVVQRGTMLAGSTKTISAREEILLTSADAGSTKVIYNGKDLGQLGRSGEVIRNVEFSAPPTE